MLIVKYFSFVSQNYSLEEKTANLFELLLKRYQRINYPPWDPSQEKSIRVAMC